MEYVVLELYVLIIALEKSIILLLCIGYLLNERKFNDDDFGFIRKRITERDDDETKCRERECVYVCIYDRKRKKVTYI
jgi:hypothetical protein